MSEVPRLQHRQLPRQVPTTEEFMQRLGATLQQAMGSSMPPWRYFKHGPIAYCWNTAPLTPTVQTKYRQWAAFKYRINKRKGTWHNVGPIVYFARRKSAKAKALAWYRKARDKKRTPSPISSSTAAATTPNTLPPTTT